MFTALQFTALYNEYLESGLTIRDFCANQQMSEAKFYYWQNKLKRQLPPKKGFVPVVFENQKQRGSFQVQSGSQSISTPAAAGNTFSCEICYPNGVSMKLSSVPDSQTLRSLLLLPH
jgi:hypothetical protein